MNPPIDPLRVSSLKEVCVACLAGHDAEKSASMIEEMLVRGETQPLEFLNRERK